MSETPLQDAREGHLLDGVGGLQGYLAHKKTPHTVAYAYGPTAVLGGGRFLISEVPL